MTQDSPTSPDGEARDTSSQLVAAIGAVIEWVAARGLLAGERDDAVRQLTEQVNLAIREEARATVREMLAEEASGEASEDALVEKTMAALVDLMEDSIDRLEGKVRLIINNRFPDAAGRLFEDAVAAVIGAAQDHSGTVFQEVCKEEYGGDGLAEAGP